MTVPNRRNAGRQLAAALMVWGLVGCASVPPGPALIGDTIAGRLSVRIDATASAPAQSVSGSFELHGTPAAGRLNLASPLGTVLAQARWNDRQAWLKTPEAETAYDNLDLLTHDMLGESLPVAALFDWLRGRPWPGASSQPLPTGFQQLGWDVDLARFAEGWVQARRPQAPTVVVRAQVEQP